MYLLESDAPFKSITVMVQKEVAQRLNAKPGTKEYGAISLAVNYYTIPKILFNVSPGSFMPAPKVSSSVIRFDVRDKKLEVSDEKLMFRLIKAGFSKRRKTLVNAIAEEFKMSKDQIINIINKSGLKCDIRAERLSIEDFARLCDNFKALNSI